MPVILRSLTNVAMSLATGPGNSAFPDLKADVRYFESCEGVQDLGSSGRSRPSSEALINEGRVSARLTRDPGLPFSENGSSAKFSCAGEGDALPGGGGGSG